MKYLGLSLVLALAACGSGSNSEAEPQAGTSAPTASASAASEQASVVRQKGRYAPRDECYKLPGLVEFRRKLSDALVKGDADAIALLASPDVKLGFGGDDGRERFLEQLKDPKGELLREMRQLLPLGCAVSKEGDMMTMPWYFAQDMGDIDGYSATIVIGEDVPVYAKADAASAVKQRISWDLVELNDGLYPEREFQLVTLSDKSKGYMATAKLRSLLDYRLIADRQGDEWKVGAILAGD